METKINTIEELVAMTIRRANSDSRYSLEVWNHKVWLDSAAGEQWQKSMTNLDNAWYERSEEESKIQGKRVWKDKLPGYQEAIATISVRRPEEKWVNTYSLKKTGSYYYSKSITLGEELGAQVAATWKTKQETYGGKSFVGAVSLKTICARLGQTGLSEQIAAAQKAVKEQGEKNTRNYHRREIETLAKKLLEEIGKAKADGLAVSEVDTCDELVKKCSEQEA